jgi:hypothetical protein
VPDSEAVSRKEKKKTNRGIHQKTWLSGNPVRPKKKSGLGRNEATATSRTRWASSGNWPRRRPLRRCRRPHRRRQLALLAVQYLSPNARARPPRGTPAARAGCSSPAHPRRSCGRCTRSRSRCLVDRVTCDMAITTSWRRAVLLFYLACLFRALRI